jgi:hypothetical protein
LRFLCQRKSGATEPTMSRGGLAPRASESAV